MLLKNSLLAALLSLPHPCFAGRQAGRLVTHCVHTASQGLQALGHVAVAADKALREAKAGSEVRSVTGVHHHPPDGCRRVLGSVRWAAHSEICSWPNV